VDQVDVLSDALELLLGVVDKNPDDTEDLLLVVEESLLVGLLGVRLEDGTGVVGMKWKI
jgi:hypothetical protein